MRSCSDCILDGTDACLRGAGRALRNDPCEAFLTDEDDAINRQAVLNTLDKMDDALDEDRTVEIYKMLLTECVTILPSATQKQKTGRWIPVSERLPEDSELVLFSTKTNRVFEGRYFADNTDCQWYSFRDDCFARNNVVTAWMPLPEPYKAESEEV